MKRIMVILWVLIGAMLVSRPTIVLAYWVENIDIVDLDTQTSIVIGQWLGDILPEVIEGWNIDEWVLDNDLNHDIPIGQLFSYQGRVYLTIGNYNPEYHGLPASNSLQWAYVSTNIDWEPGYNYRDNSVVIYNDKYYISLDNGNWNVWEPTTTWAWQEIEPIGNNRFNKFEGTNIIDYASPDWDYVIYK